MTFQSELEDLSFMYSNGEEYERLKNRVLILRKEQEEVLLEVEPLLFFEMTLSFLFAK